MLHFIKKPKIQNWRVQDFMYSNTTEKKKILNLGFAY